MISRHAVLFSLCAVLALGCPGQKPAAVVSNPVVKPAPDSGDGWRLSKSGLGFRLSEADESAGKELHPLAKSTPLSEADTKRVLDRMPKLAAEPDDAKEFALRAKSLPAPRTGKTITETFPPPLPPVTAPQVAAGPLTIARKAPEGPVDLAPRLSVSFSQPMVPITSMDDLSKSPPPVKLTPQPPGKWRWIGTQTVLFDPEPKEARKGAGGFPMATEYQVEVPAGTTSQTGGKLAAAEKWTFTTPPPKLVQSFPSNAGGGGAPVGLEPLFYLAFDQAIDPAAMLKSIDVSGNPGKRIPLRLADADEVEKDNRVRQLSKAAVAGRWLAFRATERLPAASTIVVKVKAGAPSAEGPRTTDKDQITQLQTFGPLRITQHRCGWDKTCPPLTPWYVEFSNPIDLKAFDKKMVKVDPELPGMKITASGQSITLSGRAKGRTTYKVTFASAVPDVFEQTLGKDESVSFDVGSAVPALFPEDKEMMVGDPAGGGKIPVFSVNQPGIRVRLYAVKPEDFRRYQEWRQKWDYEQKTPEPPGRLVLSTLLKPSGAADALSETAIDLAPALTKGVGQVIVIAEGTAPPRYPGQRDWFRSWVQVTGIGLDAFVDQGEALAWTTALANGAPLAGVDVSVASGTGSVKSSPDGLARIPLGMAGDVLTARMGNDVAFLSDPYGQSFKKVERTDQVRWFVFDDRKTYKPGEEVRIKGWVRRAGMGKGGDIAMVTGAKSVTWRVTDPRNNEIGKGTATLDASGGLEAMFKLPDAANLGYAQVHLHVEGTSGLENLDHTHGFSVQEFRRPEFEVSAQAPAGPHYVGGNTVATVAATYYAGGGLPGAQVDWRVTRSDASFTPPNRSEYAFGRGPLGWGWMQARARSKKRAPGESNEPPPTTETWSSKTDAMGKHRLRIDFDALDPPYAMDLALQASVTDVNRQQWTAQASVLVHPASEYVGLKQQKSFVRAGEAIQVDAIVVDVEGKSVAGRTVTIESARVDWEQEGEEYVEKEKDKASCAQTSTDAPQKCALATKDGGRYRITAIVTDDKGRRSRTDTEIWVVSDTMPKDRDLAAGAVKIIADKKEYKAGDTAELLVMGAFAPAEGVLTIARQGMVQVQRFSMRGSTATLKVKIDPAWVPNVVAHVQVAGMAPRENEDGEPDAKLPKQPAFGSGTIGLAIPPEGRTLKVDVSPREPRVEPGGTTEITLDVKEPGGKPAANATLAVVVVDEAILALSGYKLPDPLATFYSSRSDDVRTIALRSFVSLARPDVARLNAPGGPAFRRSAGYNGDPMMDSVTATAGAMAPPMQPMPAASASAAPTTPMPPPKAVAHREEAKAYSEGMSNANIAVRQDFTPIAAFIPRVVTDASGKAKVPLKLPDNLTRYRIMAIAVAGENKFGSGESTVTARLPLMVRPSAPRFLNFGDKFELPIVVQNQTDQPMTVDIAARASNAEVEATGKRVTVPANDRVEVRMLASAVKAGTARFQVGAASGKWADANQLELPVWTPATTEAFATYGEIDQGGITQPVKMPPGVVTQFGGLEITTSSTSLQALTDAVLYLVRYPYECNEQLASRILAIAALKDVLAAFQAKGLPAPEVLVDTVKKDIERLAARQGYDGGWGFWQRGDTSWPYLGIHVAHALVRAKEKGFDVPANLTARSQSYLKQIEQHIPGWYPLDERRSLIAYALFVRTLMNDADRPRAKRLIAEAGGADKLQMEANGWLLRVLTGDAGSQGELAAIRKHLANRATETAGAAHFTTSYKDGEHLLLSSDRRADGVILDSLIVDQPQSTLIPKIVTGLLAHRTAGRWTNTQENAFVLLALDRYFRTYEKTTPDFVARAWLGNTLAGEHAFKGRTTERYAVNVPMQLLATQAAQGGGGSNIVLAKDGPGRMYFRIGMQYAPADLKPPPTDHGFTVTRTYEAVDAPTDVRRDADGTWRVKAGTKVRVRLGMVVPSRRYHVALVDPIPAGLEPMNSALAVTGAIPQDPKEQANASRWWWSRTWYEHQNLRDERVEAFASLVWEGVYDYTYVARATTPGTFVVPPPKAEEMYSPETFGRGAGDRLIVE